MARRKNESDEGGREQHLDNSNVAIVAAEDSRERIGMVDAKALGGTNSKTAVVLIESDEIEGGSSHGVYQYVRETQLGQIRLLCEAYRMRFRLAR